MYGASLRVSRQGLGVWGISWVQRVSLCSRTDQPPQALLRFTLTTSAPFQLQGLSINWVQPPVDVLSSRARRPFGQVRYVSGDGQFSIALSDHVASSIAAAHRGIHL